MSYLGSEAEGDEDVLITEGGYERKQQELEEYREEAHEELPQKMSQVRSRGVVDESSLQSLKKKQNKDEDEIRRLERLLDKAKVIDGSSAAADIGQSVTLYDLVNDTEIGPYEIVPPAEVDLGENKVSTESPAISAMLERGAGVGDEFNVETPSGTRRYEVIALE